MPKDWSELISFYQGLESGQGWHYVSMEKLIQLILRKRDVNGIYPFTSHAILCLTRYKTFDEWVNKPRVSIKPASADYYWFSLTEPLEDSEIYRERSESISCRYEYALKAYDEMMEKLARLESDEPREA